MQKQTKWFSYSIKQLQIQLQNAFELNKWHDGFGQDRKHEVWSQ